MKSQYASPMNPMSAVMQTHMGAAVPRKRKKRKTKMQKMSRMK